MAIYHMRVKAFSRAKGHTAAAAAAYRAGIALTDSVTGVQHDYRRRDGVVTSVCIAPGDAPAWAIDPDQLFSQAESAEKRKDACVAREFEISLPHELSDAQRLALVEDIGEALVRRYRFAVLASIHCPQGEDDLNHHVHILATTRRIGPDGLGEKTRELDGGAAGKIEVNWAREMIADRTNHHLKAAGLDDRVDHRSLKDQALAAELRGDFVEAALLSREPTQHLGKDANALLRRGAQSIRAEVNESITQANHADLGDLLEKLVKEGRLMETPAGHTHAAAHRERGSDFQSSGEARGASSHAIPLPLPAVMKGGRLPPRLTAATASIRRTRAKTGNRGQDALDGARMAREEELERLMLDAQASWLKGLDESVRQGIIAIDRLLAQRTEWIRQYAGKAAFRSDVRAFHAAVAQAARDGSRWKRRLASEDRAEHALGQAQRELAHLDADKGRAGLWSKREWAERRRKQAERVEDRRRAREAARAATGPKAQVDYQRQSQASIQTLKDLADGMVKAYPLELGAGESVDKGDALPRTGSSQGEHVPSVTKAVSRRPNGRGRALH